MPRNCTGTLTPELGEAIRPDALAARACYELALKKEPTLTGRIVLNLTIENGGGLSECSVDEDTLQRPEVLQCIQSQFLGASFDQLAPRRSDDPTAPAGDGWDGGCLKLKLPLKFVPKMASEAQPNAP